MYVIYLHKYTIKYTRQTLWVRFFFKYFKKTALYIYIHDVGALRLERQRRNERLRQSARQLRVEKEDGRRAY
jgi:hypothetical protein